MFEPDMIVSNPVTQKQIASGSSNAPLIENSTMVDLQL